MLRLSMMPTAGPINVYDILQVPQ